jgi:hypothetical protein
MKNVFLPPFVEMCYTIMEDFKININPIQFLCNSLHISITYVHVLHQHMHKLVVLLIENLDEKINQMMNYAFVSTFCSY